jgi:hypothetical protein
MCILSPLGVAVNRKDNLYVVDTLYSITIYNNSTLSHFYNFNSQNDIKSVTMTYKIIL